MNHIETWVIDYVEDIEGKVNRYCRQHNLNPISISITYCQPFNNFVVGLVVEDKED